MATKPSKSDLADSVQIALDAADTATGVTEEFNSIKEQFEVVNIQARKSSKWIPNSSNNSCGKNWKHIIKINKRSVALV